MKEHIIVGVDPGHTIGLCALDLEGRPLHLFSIENGGLAKAVSTIESWGTPSIIACDVFPASDFVLKLASYFNVKLFTPGKDVREEFKRDILKHEEEKAGRRLASNNHERDSLSAAVMAWRDSQNLIRSAMSAPSPDSKKVVHLMLQGYRREEAHSEISSPKILQKEEETFEQTPVPNAPSRVLSKDSILSRQNISLMRRVESLENENASLRERIRNIERGLVGRLMREKEIRRLKTKISRLQSRLTEFNSVKSGMQFSKSQKQNVKLVEIRSKSHLQSTKSAEPNSKSQSQKTIPSPQIQKETRIPQKEDQNSAQTLKRLNSLDTLVRLVHEYRKGRSDKE